jgi:hypothetical protein
LLRVFLVREVRIVPFPRHAADFVNALAK